MSFITGPFPSHPLKIFGVLSKNAVFKNFFGIFRRFMVY